MIERIKDNQELLAVILRDEYVKEGLNFLTDVEESFQVGFHNVKKGKRYMAHKSKPFEKLENFKANKIYYVKSGKVGIDIYNKENKKIKYAFLNPGDLILFIEGGHGLDVIDDAKIIEIKQGPYRGTDSEKEFIEGKNPDNNFKDKNQ